MSEQAIENEIQAKNLNAPRLTPALIDAAIKRTQYYVFPDTVMTVCCLTMQNGFNVTGTSSPASPENFNEVLGKEIAFLAAREKIWELEGYRLRNDLHRNGSVTVKKPVGQ